MIRCALDEDGCIDLLAILRIMNQISQEQAWALAYELAALMQRMWPAGNNCAIIESLAQIYIHHDGSIHEKSLWTKICTLEHHSARQACNATKQQLQDSNQNDLNKQQQQQQQHQQEQRQTTNLTKLPPTPSMSPELSDEILRRTKASCENELVASLGMALFWALDYGIPDDEERKLNIAMEYLIVQSQKELSLNELEQVCIKRLPVAKKTQADIHYRSTCKSLVQDTIELSIFLDKIHTATMALNKNHFVDDDDELSDLPLAKINDWARLWMQVIRELRQRGKIIVT